MLFAPFLVLLVAGAGEAGNYTQPPGDCCPQWSPHGTQIVFTTSARPARRRATVGAVGSTGGPEQFVPGIPVGARSPDWKHVAYTTEKSGATWLTVANVDGSEEKLLAQTTERLRLGAGLHAARLRRRKDGALDVDRRGRQRAREGRGRPRQRCRPGRRTARRIAYVTTADGGTSTSSSADGGGDARIAGPAGRDRAGLVAGQQADLLPPGAQRSSSRRLGGADPALPPGRAGPAQQRLVPRRQGAALRRRADAAGGHRLHRDRRARRRTALPGRARAARPEDRQAADPLVRRRRRVLARRQRSIAFSSGGECRDRDGRLRPCAWTERSAGGSRTTARSAARAGPDTLHGTALADVLLGLGGNDRLVASDPGYVGDTLDGGPGNDVLMGGSRQDTLYGGPGDDTLSGGPSGDALVGGPGHDRLNGQGGRDTIYARRRAARRDQLRVERLRQERAGHRSTRTRSTSVASDCEIVHRS